MKNSSQIDKYVYSTKPIGKGAFSKVYKGFDIETDEIIAIKIIEKFQLKQELIERLKNEVLLVLNLKNDNIVEYKDFLEDSENFYLVLEYCNGGDLSNLIKKGKIPEIQVKAYMKQLSNAFKYLINKNIVHRDIKPQNLLLSNEQQIIKMTDFNFARELNDNDLSKTFCGTPLYMAPEIILKCDYSTKADLWSLGLVMYEMVYGKNPYCDAKSTMDLIEKINNTEISYTDIVSTECNLLLKKLLQKDPNDRITWDQFFNNKWLSLEDSTEPNYIMDSVHENLWESVALSTFDQKSNVPRRIANKKFNVQVVDNYIPLGVSPPSYSLSEPMNIRKRGSISSQGQNSHFPNSAPDRGMKEYFWNYMSNSVNILKGAVDYISSTTT